MQKRRVVILGSTGSIGTSALKVARDIPDRMEIVGLAAGTSVEALARQAREFNVRNVCIFNPSGAAGLAASLPGAQVETGEEGLCRLAQLPEADMVLISIVGTAGLKPALAAIEAGRTWPSPARKFWSWPGKSSWKKPAGPVCRCFRWTANTTPFSSA